MNVKHIVLSGGGIRGICILGSISEAMSLKLLDLKKLRTIAGSSVGALIGCLLVAGYTPKELYDEFRAMNITALLDPDLTNLTEHFGLDSGYKLVKYLGDMLERKEMSRDITFKRLFDRTKIRLIVTATNVNRKVTEYFDYFHTPNVTVLHAIRASISLPLYFTAPLFKGCRYIDGGVLDNFPLHLFHHCPPSQILAIKFRKVRDSDGDKSESKIQPISSFEQFLVNTVQCLLEEIEYLKSSISTRLYTQSTIFIDKPKQHILQFDVTPEETQEMFDIGRDATQRYMNSNGYFWLKYDLLPEEIKDLIKSL